MYFNRENIIDISKLITKKYNFFAHLSQDKSYKETLEEHTKLVEKYFFKINASKKLDDIFLNFENVYLTNVSKEGKYLFREMIINTIIMHDIGKINPNFQNYKMENKIPGGEDFQEVTTQHSLISSVLYMDYYYAKIPKEDKKILRTIMILNAYAISKHHGDLDSLKSFIENFNGEYGKGVIVLNIFKKNKESYLKDVSLGNIMKNRKVNEKLRIDRIINEVKNDLKNKSKEEGIYLYIYERLIFSILVACDFYATNEFMNRVEINEFGEVDNINIFYDEYKKTKIYKKIREYEENKYKKENDLINEKDINILRTEMFLDVEKVLNEDKDSNIFFLEAPTGSGKSNVAMNLSFRLFEKDNNLKKIFYVYPFNTLVEQNIENLKKIFKEKNELFNKIAVINCLKPIKKEKIDWEKENKEYDEEYKYYAKALLDRQFLNYPFILTTHVSLFNVMFGRLKEDIFAFHQLANSVIVLDEIQSYKNVIWTEIIYFLKAFSKILNIKVIIMSATLPNLNLLTIKNDSEDVLKNTTNLIKDREKYFSNSLFKNRVSIDYTLMDSQDIFNDLLTHVIENSNKNKKILMEFIKKESAYKFYNALCDEQLSCKVELMTGDDNIVERNRILKSIELCENEGKGVILVATQVIEAGVDIDMDIGYKDISKLDSEEQFMGRINRSCKKQGIVYFFDMDSATSIYGNDIRINNEYSLRNEEMKNILINKNFEEYYKPVLDKIIKIYNVSCSDTNINDFFKEDVAILNFKKIEERMKLIDDNNWSISVFLARKIKMDNGSILDGETVWEEYKKLLCNNKLGYAEKEVKLSEARSNLNYFVYDIKKNVDLIYQDKIGTLYYIGNGDKYFENGKLNKDKFKNEVGMFLDI